MSAKYPEKVGLLRLTEEQKEQLSSLVLRSGMSEQEVRRALLDIGITVYKYFERRGEVDFKEVKRLIVRELGVRQLNLPFDKLE